MKNVILISAALLLGSVFAIDNPGISGKDQRKDRLTLIRGGKPLVEIVVADGENSAVKIAAANLAKDFERVCGVAAKVVPSPTGKRAVTVSVKPNGKREMYEMTVGENSIEIVGSDRRGAVYGIYELSEQLGVSPWYDWADVPIVKHDTWAIKRGKYTNGEPAVRYRGIFLNDEAPCLTGWVKNTYGTSYGDHRFYARVGELILRLRGNFLWPAMWCWSFYADDPENSKTMDEMGVIMGTSHHEPMARNHQEWARHRKEFGAWDYEKNQAVLDKFFREGAARAKTTEDVITIGMRGDGDAPMGNQGVELMTKIMTNQRMILEEEYGKSAAEIPQVWALYKEVQDYYDKGLRAPDDVMYLVCDDNWGNVRRLPDAEERRHPGGWGMYYHVDYVGAPRNSKLLNCTTAAMMWEQMSLTYEYGVDRMWILNVGDLKPMEYPIQLFLDMAWNPKRFTAENLTAHMERFCAPFGGREAARIMDETYRRASRVTPEMLDSNTYDFASGEFKKVVDDYARLAEESKALEAKLPAEAKDAYLEIVGFHVELMANLYAMYYAQRTGDQEAVNAAFAKDGELMKAYNEKIAGGKWNGMMAQKHIGYTSWSDNFPKDICPRARGREENSSIRRFVDSSNSGGKVRCFEAADAEKTAGEGFRWVHIPGLGRTEGAMEVWPRTVEPKGCRLVFKVDGEPRKARVYVNTRSTLAFARSEGHRYRVNGKEVNFNSRLNEDKANVYSVFYPTVARRVVTGEVDVDLNGEIVIEPIDPGIAFESVAVDLAKDAPKSFLYGTYKPQYYKPAVKKRVETESVRKLNEKEPYITSVQRKKSYDKNMGDNWWMRRHEAILDSVKTPKEFDVVLIGDSITHRWERHGKDAYASITNELKVLNLGFGADNVRNCLWRLRSGELDGYKAKVVQLMIGTNNGDAPADSAAQIRACLREILKRQPEAKIVLCAILPRGEPDSVERGRNDDLNALLEPLCDGKTIIWKDYSEFFVLADGRVNPQLTDDKLHPNAAGYAAWRELSVPFWEEILK